MAKSQEALTRECEILSNERNILETAIKHIHSHAELLTQDKVETFSVRHDTLLDLEKRFCQLQIRIIEFNSRNKFEELKLEVQETQIMIDELIFEVQEKYLTLKNRRESEQVNADEKVFKPVVSQNVPLPKITIPYFSGQIDEWTEFKALFDSLVHKNNSLSLVEKFQYLKSYLKGDAAVLIANYELREELYIVAYEVLEKRYNNKRRLAQLHIDRILDYSKNSVSNSRNLQFDR